MTTSSLAYLMRTWFSSKSCIFHIRRFFIWIKPSQKISGYEDKVNNHQIIQQFSSSVLSLKIILYLYLVKKLIKLSKLEQISITFGQRNCTSIEERQNSMLQLIDNILSKISVGIAVSRKRSRLLSVGLSGHGQEILVGVVKRSTDLKHRHKLAIGAVSTIENV